MWDKILTLAFMGSFLSAAVRMAIPLAYAALGEMISQKSGTINIGLETHPRKVPSFHRLQRSDEILPVPTYFMGHPWRVGSLPSRRTARS